MPIVEIAVSYTRKEYLSFVQEHAPTALLRAQKSVASQASAPSPSRAMRSLIALVASLSFVFKKLRMPVCEFFIDEHHIRRRTALGELVVPWGEVVAVHRYSLGYLIEKKRGSMPLPYRAFTDDQVAEFAAILASVQMNVE